VFFYLGLDLTGFFIENAKTPLRRFGVLLPLKFLKNARFWGYYDHNMKNIYKFILFKFN
jgi:hypothetical protein